MKDILKANIVNSFCDEWREQLHPASSLHIQMSTFSVFNSDKNSFHQVGGFEWTDKVPSNVKYDFIVADLPFGLRPIEGNFFGKKLKVRQNWVSVLNAVTLLHDTGTAIFLIEPMALSTSEGRKLEIVLNEKGYFFQAVFNSPSGLLQPETSLDSVFLVITKQHDDKLFIAELLGDEQARQVVKNYFCKTDGGNLQKGIKIEREDFQSFYRVKIKQQIEKLETQYKSYKGYSLSDIAIEVNSVKSGGVLEEKENAIYIPRIRRSAVISSLVKAKLKHHNYFQVVLNDNLAVNEYVEVFFKSAIGRLVLDSLSTSSLIPHLNKSELMQAVVALPQPEEQQSIVRTQGKLHRLKIAIDEFGAELALNPTSSNSILIQLDTILEAIGGLTDTDKIRGCIREGESKNIEFKETLSFDTKKKTKEKYLAESVLKTIVAFLNTEGGTLLVGITDEGIISGLGIEIDKFYKNNDKFLLHIKNLIQKRIGEEFYPFIEYKLVKIDEKLILLVECKSSRQECYLDGKDFYVRTNPATDKLEGAKLVAYIKNHFKEILTTS